MRPKRTNIVSQLDKEQLDTLHYIYDYYSKLGMSNQDIAGIAANMFKESSFRHNSKNSSGHRGYVLMSPDMLEAVINAYGNLDPDTLLLFVYDLITGNSKVKGYTNGAGYQYGLYKTGGDAAEAFRSTFERNKAGRQQSRIDYGNQFHNYFNLRSLKQKMGQQPKPIVLQPVSTAVRPIIPLEQTKYTWTGAENVSPYVTGKPIIKLQPRLKLPSIEELMEDSEWEPPFPQELIKTWREAMKKTGGYKDGKLPGYVRQNGNDIKFDEDTGELVDQITGERGTLMLPEVRIAPKRYDAYHSTFDPNIIRNFTDWLPVVGDIGTSIDIKNAIKNQNYLEASLLGGMAILPAPLMKGVNKASRPLFNKTADILYEHFVKAGRGDLALRMLDNKAKKLNPVTKNNGEILTLYRGDTGEYNIINEHSKNPVFLSTDKNYAEMYTSNRRFYELNPDDEWPQRAVDLSDIDPDKVREFYGFGNVFNAAPHTDLNFGVAKSFFDANDYLVSKKLADDIWDKYLPVFKEIHPDYDDFRRALHAIRLKKPIPDDIPKSIYEDALRVAAVDNVNERQVTRFIRSGRYSGNNKKNPNGYFRKKDIGERPKFDETYQSFMDQDSWYENSFDPKKINPLRTIKYEGLSGRDIPLRGEVEFWRESKGREFGFRKSNNVKLRAITRDDEGKLIPLSKRLDLKNPDVRFFLPYLIGGGVGYGVYNIHAE